MLLNLPNSDTEHLIVKKDCCICTFAHVYRMEARVKSGIIGQTGKFGQLHVPCSFHSSIIGIKIS